VRALVIAGCAAILSCSDVDLCEIDLDRELNNRIGTELDLHEITDFDWSEVRLYGEYEPSELIRAETGLRYEPWPWKSHVPEGQGFVAFLREGKGICGAHYNLLRACLTRAGEDRTARFTITSHCERPK